MDVSSSAMAGLDGSQWKQQMLDSKTSNVEQADQLAQEFEGILIRQFLDKALASSGDESGLFGSNSSPMYQQMIKDTLASSITKSGSLGFSSVLQATLFSEDSTIKEGANSHE